MALAVIVSLPVVQLRRRVVKYMVILSAAAAIFLVLWKTIPVVDDLKFGAFTYACRSATERVFSTANTRELEIDYWPYSGVMEDAYYPFYLAQSLLTGPSRMTSVHLAYEMPRDKVVEAACAGKYVMVGSTAEELRKGFPACGKHVVYGSIARPRYAVRFHYAAPNFLSIRSFRITVEDNHSRRVLAEQSSYQLLLGGMNRPENRAWYGWGSAQGAKVCRLTEPKAFIMKVVGSSQ